MFGCGWGKYKEINSETSKCLNFSNQKRKQLQDYDSDKLCEQAELEMEICDSNLHLSMCVKTILFANYQKILYQLNLAKEKKHIMSLSAIKMTKYCLVSSVTKAV